MANASITITNDPPSVELLGTLFLESGFVKHIDEDRLTRAIAATSRWWTVLDSGTGEAIAIGRHGLMIVSPRGSGVLLPEVAERHEWDVPAFLRATCQKAGLPDEAWREATNQLYGFETEAWSEED